MFTQRKKLVTEDSGQALVELAISVLLLLILVFGVIDFSRAIYYVQVIKNLTAEGSSMSSRGSTLSQTAQTVMTDAGTNLSLSTKGCVIATSVLKTASGTGFNYTVTGQASQGNCAGVSSKIGCFPPPSSCGRASLPAEAAAALPADQSLFITEIFFTYTAVTPIGALLKNSTILPAQLYDAAYY
jgi:TadE-like protein